jgi:LysM repeat protein
VRPPAATTSPAEAPAPSGRVHVVERGELLATIARKYGKTVKDFERANPGLDPNRIRVGQKLNVP